MRGVTRAERPRPQKEPAQGQNEAAFLAMVEGDEPDEKKPAPKKQGAVVHASSRPLTKSPYDENDEQHLSQKIGDAIPQMRAMWEEKIGRQSVNRLAKSAQKTENKDNTLNTNKYLKHYSKEELATKKKIGDRYYVLDKIGGGGMGDISIVLDKQMDMLMVAKSVRSEMSGREDIMSRVKNEVRAVSELGSNPYIVKTYAVEEKDGVPIIIMEYVDNPDLGRRLGLEGRFPDKMTAEIAIQTCRALAAAHAHGIVHRDLKPQNIFLKVDQKDGVRVKVGDFGITKFTNEPMIPRGENPLQQMADRSLTDRGTVLGTPQFMSPEQVRGRRVDGRADLYALGIVLYKCISGRTPFQNLETTEDVLLANRDKKPKHLKEYRDNKNMKNPLEDVVMKLLEKKVGDRQQSAVEVIDEIIDTMVEAYPELAQHEDYVWRLSQRKIEEELYSEQGKEKAHS